ncbi:MAG: dipeptide ABC transporter ATP-binding protein [Candidatus Dormibacteraceae bacterium]
MSRLGPAGDALVEVRDLHTEFATADGLVRAVTGVSFSVGRAQTVGLVGESGSGKSVTALSLMGLIEPPGRISEGSIRFDGEDLVGLPREQMQALRGEQMGMIFQEPMTSLNPVYTIGDQIAETVSRHTHVSSRQAWERAVEMLDLVQVPDPRRRAKEYPHQMSGGMRQRVMIAIALCCDPKLLIADEPTTALDVTIQAQMLDLLRDLQQRLSMSVLLITHDLGVVAEMCEETIVMYAGEVVEQAPTRDILDRPQHPYTEGLLESIPKLSTDRARDLHVIRGMVPSALRWPSGCRFAERCDHRFERCAEHPDLFDVGPGRISACWLNELGERHDAAAAGSTPRGEEGARREKPRSTAGDVAAGSSGDGKGELLSVEGLRKYFPVHSSVLRRTVGQLKAVDGVDFSVRQGETLGLVGESGCGKSTLGRSLLRLIEPTSGRVHFDGRDVTALSRRQLKALRPEVQMVFQDPGDSLNPRMSVGDIVGEGLLVNHLGNRRQRQTAIRETLGRVGLRAEYVNRYPHEFSGGQRQRISIARALVMSPKLVVADEPVSALDVSIQSQVLNLMVELRKEFQLTYIFIAHNLAVVAYIADRVAVMYLGKIVEIGESTSVYQRPRHPYTRALISSIPEIGSEDRQRRIALTGDVPSPLSPPSGCRFRTRCPLAREKGTVDGICAEREPPLEKRAAGHWAACHFA